MARVNSIGIRETLTSLLPKEELEDLAYECAMVRRRRKVDPGAMLWTLALGFGTGRERTLAGLRRMYQRATGTSLVPSAFYDRFTPQLVRFLRRLVGELRGRLSEHEPNRRGLLSRFADVSVWDATVVKLCRLLASRYLGTRTNASPTAAKLHMVMSGKGKGVQRVKLTGSRRTTTGRWASDGGCGIDHRAHVAPERAKSTAFAGPLEREVSARRSTPHGPDRRSIPSRGAAGARGAPSNVPALPRRLIDGGSGRHAWVP